MKREEVVLKVFAILTGVLGLAVFLAAISPIIFYEATSRQKFPSLLSPVKDSYQDDLPITDNEDFTYASNWFEGGKTKDDFLVANITYYTLGIPKLKIRDAKTSIGGEDLSKALIHYPGTALPGRIGNTVIFGHSILPVFYNPKNYLAIFSTLSSLEAGDQVKVNYDGVEYLYKVEDMFEVSPTDIQILEQDRSDSFLTLVTCTPPGHPLRPKRLVVRARIVPLGVSNFHEEKKENTRS